MLYAENDFVDKNINTVDQQYISIFGNMTAGNQVRLNREVGGSYLSHAHGHHVGQSHP